MEGEKQSGNIFQKSISREVNSLTRKKKSRYVQFGDREEIHMHSLHVSKEDPKDIMNQDNPIHWNNLYS